MSEQAGDPLEASALWGSPKVFKYLLERQGFGNLSMQERIRLLDLCIQSLPYEVLSPGDASPQSPEWSEHLAAWYRRVAHAQGSKDEILATLIKLGCPIDIAGEDGMKPIHLAAFHGNVPAIQRLLAAGARLDEPSQSVEAPEPMEPFHGPATSEWYEGKSRQFILQWKRDRTALELAIIGRFAIASSHLSLFREDLYVTPSTQKNAVCLLIEQGADVNHRGPDGLTPLMLASRLLACRDFHEPGKERGEPFGDPKAALAVIRRLLDRGADPRAVGSNLTTPLSAAASAGFEEAIALLKPLVPHELPVPGQSEGKETFDPYLVALSAVLEEGNLMTAKHLFSPGMRVFDPCRLGDEEGQHPSAVELAARQSTSMVEFLIANEKNPALVQRARNLELTYLLRADGFNSVHQDKGRRIQAIRETLDRGARIAPGEGFRWESLPSVLSPDHDEGDAVFLRMLRQDLPIDPKSISNLIHRLADIPGPRGLELLKALHDKAGSFGTLPDKREALRYARAARDDRFYPQLAQWIGNLGATACTEELVDVIAEGRMPIIAHWLDQGADPYLVIPKWNKSALERVWESSDTVFYAFIKELNNRHLIRTDIMSKLIGDSLSRGVIPGPENLDALASVGVTLEPLAHHPLWSKSTPPTDPYKSFYNFSPHAEKALLELARRGFDLNRDFEGKPFLVGIFSYALYPHDADLIKAVLKQGASVKTLVDKATFLHHTAAHGQTEIAQVFLDAGIPINSHDSPFGATPIMWASRAGDSNMVEWLLERGADPNAVTTIDGWSALGIANYLNRDGSHSKVIKVLEHVGAISSAPKDSSNAPSH